MLGAVRVLVVRAGGHLLSSLLRAEVRATPQCGRETAPWTRWPGGCWKTGSKGFWLDRCLLGLAAPVSTTLKGWTAGSKCKGQVGGWVAFGVRANIFAVWRALPTFIFALLQAECACQIQTQTRSYSR